MVGIEVYDFLGNPYEIEFVLPSELKPVSQAQPQIKGGNNMSKQLTGKQQLEIQDTLRQTFNYIDSRLKDSYHLTAEYKAGLEAVEMTVTVRPFV